MKYEPGPDHRISFIIFAILSIIVIGLYVFCMISEVNGLFK